MEAAEETVTHAMTVAPAGLPILQDPEVREALAKLRTVLEVMAVEYGPIVDRARELPDVARLIPVTTAAEYEYLREWLAAEVATVEDDAKRIVDPFAGFAHRVHRALTSLRSLATDPAALARAIAKPKIIAWDEAVERERRRIEEENRKAREAADRKAAIEQGLYLFGVAVAQVAELETAKAEKLAAANAAAKAGDKERAAAMRNEAERVETPTVQPQFFERPPAVVPTMAAPERPKGIAKNWKARLLSRRDLIVFVAAHPEYENLLDLNQGSADKLAKALEGNLKATVAGLEGFNDPTVRTAGKR